MPHHILNTRTWCLLLLGLLAALGQYCTQNYVCSTYEDCAGWVTRDISSLPLTIFSKSSESHYYCLNGQCVPPECEKCGQDQLCYKGRCRTMVEVGTGDSCNESLCDKIPFFFCIFPRFTLAVAIGAPSWTRAFVRIKTIVLALVPLQREKIAQIDRECMFSVLKEKLLNFSIFRCGLNLRCIRDRCVGKTTVTNPGDHCSDWRRYGELVVRALCTKYLKYPFYGLYIDRVL